MVYSAFLDKEKGRDELKEELDSLEIQLHRMQNNMKEIAKKSEIISIDQANEEQWVIIYADKGKKNCQVMLHECTKPYRGDWDSAIQAEFRSDSTLHIADIKGVQNKGFGSVLMKHLKEIAREENMQFITGDIVERDFDHVNRLKHFYRKHHFNIKIDHEHLSGEIVWNDR
ncbi:N-acetyltransferase [Oceanobacillus manasiensis]|uniref:GNAT family N-acetyltransferase n=1 Tax=Oceanobacillus manasiensis TaxID=586413 RepID=UPI0005A82B70|nr:GNAT family N-acetyltransferase [Oceanobacillus manasiensis]